MFNQFVGGELEYIDGGTVRDGAFGIDSTGLNASLKGNWPITEQFDVFGKVGYYFWDADIDFSGNSGQEATRAVPTSRGASVPATTSPTASASPPSTSGSRSKKPTQKCGRATWSGSSDGS